VQYFLKYNLPENIFIPLKEIPLMFILYFLGAIPEEIGWTYILTTNFTKKYSPIYSGFIIGLVWAIWHIIPWGLNHSRYWTFSMCLLTILMRIVMVFIYVKNKSLFLAIIFHMMSNVSISIYPNNASHFTPILFCFFMVPIIIIQIIFHKKVTKNVSKNDA
jgi:membrane protease YdiL (CAAX protease family)